MVFYLADICGALVKLLQVVASLATIFASSQCMALRLMDQMFALGWHFKV
jgi:hypothetical protein